MLTKKAKALVYRTAMIGGGLAYHIIVPIRYVRNYSGERYTTIQRDNKLYISYVDATTGEDHYQMEKGHDRYDAFLSHEMKARAEELTIARRVFPELEKYNGDVLPALWLKGLVPKEEETSAQKVVKL